MITLEAHRCDTGVTYLVHFEGPGPRAEDMALAFLAAKSSTHAITEHVLTERVWVSCPYGGDSGHYEYEPINPLLQPFLVNAELYPRLYAALYPVCEHGMSERGCYGPDHYTTLEEMAQGW